MGPGIRAGSELASDSRLRFSHSTQLAACSSSMPCDMEKAIVVVPMVNGLFPLVTIVVSLLIYREIPTKYNLAGMVLALVAVLFMAFDEVRHSPGEAN